LAQSWNFSSDGKDLTLHLRDTGTFTDGSPVRADAVKFSLDRAKSVPNSFLAGALAAVASVDVVDPLTVVLHLSTPTNVILYNLASTSGAVLNPKVINDSTDWSKGPPMGGGSGGYIVTDFVASQHLVVQRVDRPYWDPAANQVKRWDIQGIPDPTAALNGLLSGESAFAGLLNADVTTTQQKIDAANGYQLINAGNRNSKVFMMNTNKPYLQDARVRQAIAYGVDWETITKNVLGSQTPVALLMDNYFISASRGKIAGPDIPELQQKLLPVTDPTASDAATAKASQDAARYALDKQWMVQISGEPALWGAKKTIKGLDDMEVGVIGLFVFRYVYSTT
jgi:peptide/nickel transport system substrate-binding protein